MINLSCCAVYNRGVMLYLNDGSQVVGSDPRSIGYVPSHLGASENIRVYKITVTKSGTYKFYGNFYMDTASHTTDMVGVVMQADYALKSSYSAFANYRATTVGDGSFSCQINSGGSLSVTGCYPTFTFSTAGTYYLGVWLRNINFSGDKLAVLSIDNYTPRLRSYPLYGGISSRPTTGQTFSVNATYYDTDDNLSWRLEMRSTDGTNTLLYLSDASTSESLSATASDSWFAYQSPAAATLSVLLKFRCEEQDHNTTTHNVTFYPGAGLSPTVAASALSLSPVNAGSINAYIATLSQVQALINAGSISYKYGASLYSYTVKLNGVPFSGSGTTYTSNVLAISGAQTITLTVRDSRGLSTTITKTITALAYTRPSLSDIGVYRCDSGGTATDVGTYFRAKAKQQITALTDGTTANAATTHVYRSENGGAFVELSNLPNNIETAYSGLNASKIYEIKLVATDLAGGTSSEYIFKLSFERWMFCCMEDGNGVAIGMTASNEDVLEIPDGWTLKSGAAEFGDELLKLSAGAHYGTGTPSGVGENGELYFKLSSSGTGWITATPYIYISS